MDLIERAALRDEILSEAVIINRPQYLSREDTVYLIDCAPTVSAEREGEWIYPIGLAWNYICSLCGANGGVIGSNYCPNCGARMRGKGNGYGV